MACSGEPGSTHRADSCPGWSECLQDRILHEVRCAQGPLLDVMQPCCPGQLLVLAPSTLATESAGSSAERAVWLKGTWWSACLHPSSFSLSLSVFLLLLAGL